MLLSYALDRLSRKQTHVGILVEEVEQRSARLDFVTEDFEATAVGQLVRSVKAFAAEFEREKIAERTMRGKLERARSGRLPQGTGRGMYGYIYDPETGRREVNEEQAAVVRRIFERFVSGDSVNRVAQALNAGGLRSFSGTRWHPLTVRRVLSNEAYTGRTLYRARSHEGDAQAIEIPGATPPIVDRDLFRRAQAILSDPARRRRGRPTREYSLRGRLRCAACGTRMVGQALQRGRYHYYRCRNSYGPPPGEERCISRYVRTDAIEPAVKSAISDLLADPERILAEAELRMAKSTPSGRLAELETQLHAVERSERRLVQLFTRGDRPETALEAERDELAHRRTTIEDELQTLQSSAEPAIDIEALRRRLPEAVQIVRKLVAHSAGDEPQEMLRALDIEVRASTEAIEIEGSVPAIARQNDRSLVTIEQTSA